jgi:NAD(P)-dependent dehydrogenase (short-subunit alcohol dehydrogenase family)
VSSLEFVHQALLTLAPFVAQDASTGMERDSSDRIMQLAGRTWSLFQDIAKDYPRIAAALAIYQEEPDDRHNIERLARGLTEYLQQHDQIASELRDLFGQLQQLVKPTGIQVTFNNTGENHGQQVGINTGMMELQSDSGQRGGLSFGSGNQYGDLTFGDIAGRDINRTEITQGDRITTGDISGSGIAIGRGARSSVRNIDTGGGDYAEGSIDKRKGKFVSGDQFTMSGNFSGAILNIKSTLTNVSQSIGAAPVGDAATKAQLQALVEQLSAELQQVPAEQAGEAEHAAKRAESAVAEATKPNPDKDDVEYSLSRLKKAAENIAQVLPTVLPIATQIADVLRKMIGG